MGRIFLSYAREDRSCAEKLARVLEANGHRVWWDRHIDGGEDFGAEIESELEQADVVLVAWSKNSITSRWVRDEASAGGDSGRLVPVTIDGSRPPMGFRQFHTLELTGWKGSPRDRRTAELLHSVDRLTGKEAAAPDRVPPNPESHSLLRGRRPMLALAAVMLVLLACMAAYLLLREKHQSAGGGRPTLAILPFTATSSDPELKALASDARDSTAHDFSDAGMPIRLIDALPANGAPADYLMFGEFSGTPDKVIAIVRLDDARHSATIWSRRFEVPRTDAPVLAERVGAQVAGSLSWAAVLRTLDQKQSADPSLVADLLRSMDLTGDALEAYQIAKRLAQKWPQAGLPQLGVAFYTAFTLSELPRDQRPQAVATARQASERAKALMPDFGDTYIPKCLLQTPTLLAACEDRLRAGLRADPDAPFVDLFLARLLADVGRSNEAFERARLSYVHDRYVPAKIASMIRMLTLAGNDIEADKLYEQGIGWWPESGLQEARLWGFIERGDFESLVRFQDRLGPKKFDSSYAEIAAVARAVTAHSLVELKRNCSNISNGDWLRSVECMLAFAKLGDQDSAYALADEYYPDRVGRSPGDAERIWLDQPDAMPLEFLTTAGAAGMRRDPRYLGLAQRTGLVAYWRSGRHPDFCSEQPEPICASLLRG